MTTPPFPAPPADAPDDAAALEMDDVITAIFRMFDGHIDAVLGAPASAPFDAEAHAPVTLVGAPAPGGSAPHG